MTVFYLTDEDLVLAVHNTNEGEIAEVVSFWLPAVKLRVITEQEFSKCPNDVVYAFDINDLDEVLADEFGHPDDYKEQEEQPKQQLSVVNVTLQIVVGIALAVIVGILVGIVSGPQILKLFMLV